MTRWPVVGLVFLPLILCPKVYADDTDQQFLNMLDARGVTYNSPHDIVSYAHGICSELQENTYPQVVTMILRDFPSLPRIAGETLTQISIKYYCPEYSSKIIDETGVL